MLKMKIQIQIQIKQNKAKVLWKTSKWNEGQKVTPKTERKKPHRKYFKFLFYANIFQTFDHTAFGFLFRGLFPINRFPFHTETNQIVGIKINQNEKKWKENVWIYECRKTMIKLDTIGWQGWHFSNIFCQNNFVGLE